MTILHADMCQTGMLIFLSPWSHFKKTEVHFASAHFCGIFNEDTVDSRYLEFQGTH